MSRVFAKKEMWENPPAKTSEMIAISLIRMFNDGPDVSFKGSPMVSPTTAALCSSDFFFNTQPSFPTRVPLSISFLALSQAPPVLDIEMAS